MRNLRANRTLTVCVGRIGWEVSWEFALAERWEWEILIIGGLRRSVEPHSGSRNIILYHFVSFFIAPEVVSN